MKNKTSKILGEVYIDILRIEILPTTTFDESIELFYEVMRKHGIKQGELSENGRTVNNGEWTICWETFKSITITSFFMWRGLIKEIPEDLSHN